MAAGRRRRRGRAGRSSASPGPTARARPRAGSSTSWPRPGADPSAFVGALLAGRRSPADRRRPRDGGAGATFVVEADEYAGNFDAYRPAIAIVHERRMGPPGRVRRSRGRRGRVRGWLRRGSRSRPAPAGRPRRQRRRPGRRGARRRRLPRLAGPIVVTALVDAPRQRMAGYAGDGRAYATPTGPAASLIGRIVAAAPDGTTVEILGRSASTSRSRSALRRRAATTSPTRSWSSRRARALGVAPRADRRRAGALPRASAGAWSARARPAASWCTTTTAITRRRSGRRSRAVRQREPGRRVWAVYEPLTFHRTAALLDGFAAALAEADAVADRRHLGRPRPRHDDRLGRRARPRRGRAPARPRGGGARLRRGDRRLAGRAVRPGDAVLVMGGGRSYRIGELLLEAPRLSR